MDIGKRIKALRLARGWTQRELAAKLGYTAHTTLVRIENGKTDLSRPRLIQFAEVLGVSPAYLIGLEDDPSEEARSGLCESSTVSDSAVERLRQLGLSDSEFEELLGYGEFLVSKRGK